MHRKLGFIWKTYAQPPIGVIGIPRESMELSKKESDKLSKPHWGQIHVHEEYVKMSYPAGEIEQHF